MNSDPRLSLIKQWLSDVLHTEQIDIAPASSDASFRRYFRVNHQANSYIVMDAPPEQEDIEPFVRIASYLKTHHVNVPEIFARSDEHGFLLLTDFGSEAFLAKLNDASADVLYQQAINGIISIQQSTNEQFQLPLYDQALLKQEMTLFPEWFLTKHLSLTPPSFLEKMFNALTDNAIEQPQTIVHRDYHSRNLMYVANQAPGIIDFQDAVIGPITYDLVSLLRDCYISWPEQRIDELLSYYLANAQQQQLLPLIEFKQFKRWFDLMGLQRHIKVLGIFCRLYYRDGKNNYLNDLPLTLHYVIDVASRYPEFAELVDYLQHPKIQAIL